MKTLAAALTSRSFSLGGLADFLETADRKHSTEEHGGPLTTKYIDYAVQDVRVTWQCYVALLGELNAHDLSQTRASQVLSEASLGKACLREMAVAPWREVQLNVPDSLIGLIMSTYYGGRSEVHLRRVVRQVLYCDFLSMYPTVCTLMQLWRFVIARGVKWKDTTKTVAGFLDQVALPDLQKLDIWTRLRTIVQVRADDGILPVRASYADEPQATIGLNHLKSKSRLWFTLADCIASKLLTGRTPKIVRAITFQPMRPQDGLKPIQIAGSREYAIDPYRDDFYRTLIDMRSDVKAKLKRAGAAEKHKLETEQQSLKIMANATSYGIFVELIVEKLEEQEKRLCHGPSSKAFEVATDKGEQPGRYFHPLLATLITGAARLLLAISEMLARQNGLDWALCDTDSMALAKPEDMSEAEFFKQAQCVCDWFAPLNPYRIKGPLFKIEDANYGLSDKARNLKLEPLYCFAVSAKRYALFNIGAKGRPIIRKATAHGLGHLRAPYDIENVPPSIPSPSASLGEIGVERWQYDLWYQIIASALAGRPDQVDLSYHPSLDRPAASRYGATTPELLRWFATYNHERPYRDQVKPFNFLISFQASTSPHSDPRPKPIAPYDSNSSKAARKCFCRETGLPVPASQLQNYRQALRQYHLHPESKFENGEPFDIGPTRRRHVEVTAVRHIGKEANKWEEQFHLGFDEDEQMDYGTPPAGVCGLDAVLRKTGIGQRRLANESGLARETIAKMCRGEQVRKTTAAQVWNAVSRLSNQQTEPQEE